MTLADLTPDVALKTLLSGKVTVDADAKEVKVYAQGEQPNVGVADDYITVLYNGVITSWTKPIGYFSGNLALSVNSKLNSNRTIKLNRLRKLVEQCCLLIIDKKTADGFFFEITHANVITPPTPNDTTGYATTTINVAWHTT